MATRVPVPDEYERDVIVCRGTADLPRNADVVLEDRAHARNLRVYEDDEGRYVGTDAETAQRIAEFLGVELPEADGDDEADGGSDGDDEPTVAEQVDAGECPWCDDYDGDHVGQHASSAHPDEWDAFKDDD